MNLTYQNSQHLRHQQDHFVTHIIELMQIIDYFCFLCNKCVVLKKVFSWSFVRLRSLRTILVQFLREKAAKVSPQFFSLCELMIKPLFYIQRNLNILYTDCTHDGYGTSTKYI